MFAPTPEFRNERLNEENLDIKVKFKNEELKMILPILYHDQETHMYTHTHTTDTNVHANTYHQHLKSSLIFTGIFI